MIVLCCRFPPIISNEECTKSHKQHEKLECNRANNDFHSGYEMTVSCLTVFLNMSHEACECTQNQKLKNLLHQCNVDTSKYKGKN